MRDIIARLLPDLSDEKIDELVFELERSRAVKAANALNELNQKDPRTMQSLLSINISTTQFAAETPFYVSESSAGFSIGALGLIQGVVSDEFFIQAEPYEVVGTDNVCVAKFFTVKHKEGKQ